MNTPQTTQENDTTNITPDRYKGNSEKLEQLKPILMQLRFVRTFTLSAPWAISAAIRCWESYLVDQAKFLKVFTPEGFDAEALEDFPERIAVLWYLDGLLGQVVESAALSPELLARARPLHEKMARAAAYVFAKDPTLKTVVRNIRNGRGHLDLANDLNRFALLFDEQWDNIRGRCDVTRADIDAAGDISVEMLTVLTANKHPELEALKELRSRAGEYLCQGAETIRRAAEYLCDEDDEAMERYPSLYRNRVKARRRVSAAQPEVVEAPVEAAI